MTDKGDRYRMDFVTEKLPPGEGKGGGYVIVKPDPRRYEWQVIEGVKFLIDKFDRVLISEASYFEMMKGLNGMPMYFQQQTIGSAQEYVASRQVAIDSAIAEPTAPTGLSDKSEEFLQSLSADRLHFVIMSVDIVGSTKLATSVEPEQYAKLIRIVLYELSHVVPRFHGNVLKYTGDGIIAYFPAPSFITKNDLALDCALTIRRLVRDAINPSFSSKSIPEIDVRIGLDAGEAFVETIGSSDTKQHKDIIGSVVSLAAKIQATGRPGEIRLGDIAHRNLHTSWRLICEPADPDREWEYKGRNGKPYGIYRTKPLNV